MFILWYDANGMRRIIRGDRRRWNCTVFARIFLFRRRCRRRPWSASKAHTTTRALRPALKKQQTASCGYLSRLPCASRTLCVSWQGIRHTTSPVNFYPSLPFLARARLRQVQQIHPPRQRRRQRRFPPSQPRLLLCQCKKRTLLSFLAPCYSLLKGLDQFSSWPVLPLLLLLQPPRRRRRLSSPKLPSPRAARGLSRSK
jgi:hypothetical protein